MTSALSISSVLSPYSNGTSKVETQFEKIDFSYYNRLFGEINSNIRFIHAMYPCTIHAKSNNMGIAVALWNENMENIVEAMARDFERMLFQVAFHDEEKYKESLSTFYTVKIHEVKWKNYFTDKENGNIYIFATKYKDDIEYLKKVGYNFHDDRFYADVVETTKYLENIRKECEKIY